MAKHTPTRTISENRAVICNSTTATRMLGGATDVPPRKSCKPYGPMPASHRAVVPFGTVRPAHGTIARVKGSPLEPAETRKDAGGELRDQVTVFWEGGYASCPRPRRGTLVLGRHPSCENFIDHRRCLRGAQGVLLLREPIERGALMLIVLGNPRSRYHRR